LEIWVAETRWTCLTYKCLADCTMDADAVSTS